MHKESHYNEVILTVDCGTGSVRVAAVDNMGVILAIKSRTISYTPSKVSTHRKQKGFLEDVPGSTFKGSDLSKKVSGGLDFDPVSLRKDILFLLAEVIVAVQKDKRIVGISITSQRNGCVGYNEHMQEVFACPNIDSRVTQESLKTLPIGGEEFYSITGRWPNVFFPAMRLYWLKKNDPVLFKKIRYLSMINDWIAWLLSGKLKAEPSNAVETMLYDLQHKNWSISIIHSLGLDQIQMPELISSGSRVGSVKTTLLTELGLKQPVDIFLAPADTQSALLGCGLNGAGAVGIVNGSTTPVLMLTDELLFDNLHRTWTDPYWENTYALESNCTRTGIYYHKYVENLNEFLRIIGCDKTFNERELETLLVDEQTNSSTLLFPGTTICDFSKPTRAKNFILHDFENRNLFTEFFRAGVETIAFATVANIRQLEKITGFHPQSITITGGGARSSYYRSIIAQLCMDIPVYSSKEFETTSIGAATVAFADRYGKRNDIRGLLNDMQLLPQKEDQPDEVNQSLSDKYEAWVMNISKYSDQSS